MNQSKKVSLLFNLKKASQSADSRSADPLSADHICADQLPQVLATAFTHYKPIYETLSELSMSPYQAVTHQDKLTHALHQQSQLALQLGGALLESFTYEESVEDLIESFLEGYRQWSLDHDSSTSPAKEIDEHTKSPLTADAQSNDSLSNQHKREIHTDSSTHSSFDQAESPSLESLDSSPVNASQEKQSNPTHLIAKHTGRSIDLPTEPEWKIDTDLLMRQLQPTFEDGSRSIKETADRYTRFLKNIDLLPRPIEIFSKTDFQEAYSWIQRLADSNYLSLWNSNGGKFCRKIAQFVVNYTRYLSSLDFTLRPASMRGENAYSQYLKLVQSYMHEHGFGYVHGLDRQVLAQSGSWFQDTLNAFNRLKEEYDQLMNQPEVLNGDQQLDLLRSLVDQEYQTWELLDQVRLILKQTEISHQDSRLCALLGDHLNELQGSEFKSLRSSIRNLIQEENEETAQMNQILSLQNSFPDIEFLAHKTIVMIGGDRRNDTYERLQKLLPESTSLEWIEAAAHKGSNAVQSLQQRINQGGVDVVLLIQNFLSHSVSMPLKETIKNHPTCKSQMVVRGYGQTQLCVALQKVAKELKLEHIFHSSTLS